ncbi:MAG: hypothetical protein JKX84_05100 [Flavobacteriales bacterium]|nr:hypothetical protein [Flavobacteriales bacterium]
MEKPTILELRGNGALVRVGSIATSELQFLKDAAKKYGEELPTAWFDPAFRWKTEVRKMPDNVTVISENRGLLMDGRSFLEVRRFRKRRRKLPMEELLNPNLLFPLVQSKCFEYPAAKTEQTTVIEITYGIGNMGRFELTQFNLFELELNVFHLPSTDRKLVLFSKHQNREMMCLKDDFLVRGFLLIF